MNVFDVSFQVIKDIPHFRFRPSVHGGGGHFPRRWRNIDRGNRKRVEGV
jgi:hypothetical protein